MNCGCRPINMNMTIPSITSARNATEPCKCCGGTGVQRRNDGIVIKCPCCGGSGLENPPVDVVTIS